MSDELLRAVDFALTGNWEAAHRIVQEHEDDAIAAWIHAVLHKVEGDPGNSRYWYRRARRPEESGLEPTEELRAIRRELAG